MRTTISKLTKKYQATIPGPVRKTLHLQAGDSITFDIDGDDVRLRKAQVVDLAFTGALEGILNEWESEADEDAYRDL
jgi:AbrB family looped-hinge helix DNA binding protein